MLGYDINYQYRPDHKPKTSIKRIVVPFNFTNSAYVGLKYATGFANLINAEMIILNCFQNTALGSNSTTDIAYSTETSERRDEIVKEVPGILDVSTTMLVEHAFLPEMLKELCDSRKVDMVIMGTEISGDRQKMFGTNASSLIRLINVPLVIIPDDLDIMKLDDIMFAVDFKEFKDLKSVETLKMFAQVFNARIHIVHVSSQDINANQVEKEVVLDNCFDGVEHKFYDYNYPDIHNGLKNFSKIQPVDLIAMTPRKHGFIESMYKPSETKRMALDTKIPLLVFNS